MCMCGWMCNYHLYHVHHQVVIAENHKEIVYTHTLCLSLPPNLKHVHHQVVVAENHEDIVRTACAVARLYARGSRLCEKF